MCDGGFPFPFFNSRVFTRDEVLGSVLYTPLPCEVDLNTGARDVGDWDGWWMSGEDYGTGDVGRVGGSIYSRHSGEPRRAQFRLRRWGDWK